nr:RNA-directed DNA polymerase, eukaryota [Tanacetum cinerariifolium]
LNTLSVGGRLTLLKSVLGSTPIYNMLIFKVPKSVLNLMESLCRNFFNGIQDGDRNIAWVKWSKVLAFKKYGGLGVSIFMLSIGLFFSSGNDQILDLESPISKDEIRTAVWGCDVDKSPGLDGFTFEFFRKYWAVVGPDFSTAVEWFFEHEDFAIGCNSSFVALISKV